MAPPSFNVPPPSGGGGGGGGGSSSGGGGGGGSRSSGGGSSSSGGGGGSSQRVQDPWVVIGKKGKPKYVWSVEPPKNALKVFGLPVRRSDYLETKHERRENPWVVIGEGGKVKFSRSILAPKNALKIFGQPATRSDFLQAKSHYNDLFGAWLGRKASDREIASILRTGVSDYQLRLAFTKKKGFRHGAMYRTLQRQASDMLGVEFRLSNQMVRRAMRAEGGISEASLRNVLVSSPQARRAVTRSFQQTSGSDVQYALGAFGGGALGARGMQALALQESGLKQSTLGARIQSSVDKALQRQQRIFSGTLATPQLSIGQSGLQATSLQPEREADLPA